MRPPTKRLPIIAALPSTREQAMGSAEIAAIVGQPVRHVSYTLHHMWKAGKLIRFERTKRDALDRPRVSYAYYKAVESVAKPERKAGFDASALGAVW